MYAVVILDIKTNDLVDVKCEIPSKDIFENKYIPKKYPRAEKLDDGRYKISDNQCITCVEEGLTNIGLALSLITSVLTIILSVYVICLPIFDNYLFLGGFIGGLIACFGYMLISVIYNKCLKLKLK